MVPGWLSGQYTFDQIAIDFKKLSQAAQAVWIESAVHWLDPDEQRIGLTNGSQLTYDTLSLNVGSTLEPPEQDMLTLRPLADLRDRFESLLTHWTQQPGRLPHSLTVIGGGAAGFEVVLALNARLAAIRNRRQSMNIKAGSNASVKSRLITRAPSVLQGQSWLTQRLAARCLEQNAIQCLTDTEWSGSMREENDLVVWATGAVAHAWQRDASRRGSLAVNEHGYIRIDSYLRSMSHPNVFAAGDCAHFEGSPACPDEPESRASRSPGLPKAGVYAVRMGPVLRHNLLGALGKNGKTDAQTHGFESVALRQYRPQRHFLTLLNTSDGRAIASRSALAAQGRWAMHWKDRIDASFVEQFRISQP